MFTCSRDRALKSLILLQRLHCDYDMKPPLDPPDFCDCKYGGPDPRGGHGEKNGCPELRCAVKLLEGISDDLWEEVMNK